MRWAPSLLFGALSAFTQADPASVTAAIVALAKGRRVVSVTAGNQTVWETISKWIEEKRFPASKLDGVWEADSEMIIDWRKDQLKAGDGD